MSKTITKSMKQLELIAACAQELSMSKTQMETILKAVGSVVLKSLSDYDNLTFPVLGKFNKKRSAARSCRNPKTGELMEVAAKNKMTFTPSAFVKQSIQK